MASIHRKLFEIELFEIKCSKNIEVGCKQDGVNIPILFRSTFVLRSEAGKKESSSVKIRPKILLSTRPVLSLFFYTLPGLNTGLTGPCTVLIFSSKTLFDVTKNIDLSEIGVGIISCGKCLEILHRLFEA